MDVKNEELLKLGKEIIDNSLQRLSDQHGEVIDNNARHKLDLHLCPFMEHELFHALMRRNKNDLINHLVSNPKGKPKQKAMRAGDGKLLRGKYGEVQYEPDGHYTRAAHENQVNLALVSHLIKSRKGKLKTQSKFV